MNFQHQSAPVLIFYISATLFVVVVHQILQLLVFEIGFSKKRCELVLESRSELVDLFLKFFYFFFVVAAIILYDVVEGLYFSL